MFADRTGFVKTIHETTLDELLGVVVVGMSATEIVNAGVVGIDSEARVDTIGDSITAHPTLAEALKEAALMGLERPAALAARKKEGRGRLLVGLARRPDRATAASVARPLPMPSVPV